MKKLIYLLGVRGSGKSTLLDSLSNEQSLIRLKTSTTREQRNEEDNEYHFYKDTDWNKDDFIYDISIDSEYSDKKSFYGLEKKELDKINLNHVGISVLHPLYFDDIDVKNKLKIFEIVTIGLNTVPNIEAQKERVNNDPSRIDNLNDFNKQIENIKKCDICLSGDAEAIKNGLLTVVNLILNRGILGDKDIRNLINAGTLLTKTDDKQIQPASYDLRLDEAGHFIAPNIYNLDTSTPAIEIAPYSYIIAKSSEQMKLPKFISARFDLKVSLFVQGIIFQNATQVEPGYEGAIFCLLYNASGDPVSIDRNKHFSTIEFSVTSCITEGYDGSHQGLTEFEHHTDGSNRNHRSELTERLSTIEAKINQPYKALRWLIVIIIGTFTAFIIFMLTQIGSIDKEKDKAITEIKKTLTTESDKTITETKKTLTAESDNTITKTKKTLTAESDKTITKTKKTLTVEKNKVITEIKNSVIGEPIKTKVKNKQRN